MFPERKMFYFRMIPERKMFSLRRIAKSIFSLKVTRRNGTKVKQNGAGEIFRGCFKTMTL